MNFNLSPLRIFRILLLPFSLLYGLIIAVRNFLFDKNILKSVSFELPVIAVGNLSTGGTGKSPMVEHLIGLLSDRYNLATLSRGYNRKTKGYLLANDATTALEIGDEPMQFHSKFPAVSVAVGEDRIAAIPHLLHDRPDTEVIILDDAFQHRSVKPGLNILLTEFGKMFTRDFFLPVGNLRDQRFSYKRADIIVVTKCTVDMTIEKKNRIEKEVSALRHQRLFFTSIHYSQPYHLVTKELRIITSTDTVLLVCGIADPRPLRNYLLQQSENFHQITFSDHHAFTGNDVKEIRKKLDAIKANQKIIITTEKDAVRLIAFVKQLGDLPVFVLPVAHHFLYNEAEQFNTFVTNYIKNSIDKKQT